MAQIYCRTVGEYREPELERLARALKSGSPEAIRQAAALMAGLVGSDAILVPVPSHTGRAGYTLQLARELSRLTGSSVADVLMCHPRKSSYELKHEGVVLKAEEMELQLMEPLVADRQIVLVDNIIASGNTAKAAINLLPGAIMVTLASDSKAIGRLPDIVVHQQSMKEMNKNIKSEKEQGVVLVKADGMTLAADFYRNAAQREKMWRGWVDVAISKGLNDRMDFHVADYAKKPSAFRGMTDKQVGFLLQEEKPVRTLTAYEAAYAKNNKIDWYDVDAVRQYINADRPAYSHFMTQQSSLTQRLNVFPLADSTAVDGIPRIQRVFRLKDHLSFDGNERITGIDDVAWLFRFLQDRSVENTFAVLTKGDESMVLHLATGSLYASMAEPHVVTEAARRMVAEKVWFVHNHPSGKIYASQSDVNIHNTLKEQLGGILQPSIIINTDTGKYGVFNEKCSGTHYWEWYSPEKQGENCIRIPVYAFDNRVFHGKGKDRYVFNDANDVAQFLSTQRLGERNKYSMIVMDNKAQLNGYYHLPFSDLRQVKEKELEKHIVSLVTHSQGYSVILVGKDDGELIQRADAINESIEKYAGSNIKLRDVLQMNRNNIITRSWFNETMETRERLKNKNPYMRIVAAGETGENDRTVRNPRIDNIQVKISGSEPFVNGKIRCRIDGEQQMFQELHPDDLKKWEKSTGELKEQMEHLLANKYFKDCLEEKMKIQTGFKR